MPQNKDGVLTVKRRTVMKTIGVGLSAGSLSVGTASAQEFESLCEAIPLDVVLVLDRSGSMSVDSDGDGNTKLEEVQTAAKGFVDRLTSTDRVGLVSFANDVTLNQSLTGDFNAVKSQIGSLTAGGSTNLGGGVDAGHNELNTNGRSDATPILVVLSNGQENVGPDATTEAQEAKDDGIRVITIAFGAGADTNTLKDMASDPKDKNFFEADSATVNDIFATISQEICPTVVDIDIKPGSDPNAINCNPHREGVIPVAVLTDDDFDATVIDPSSLRFGSPSTVVNGDGATVAHHGGHLEDADSDGDTDFVGHFPVKNAGFSSDDTEGWLIGETEAGAAIAGRDSVKIVGKCR